MANCCMITIVIEFFDKENTGWCHTWLSDILRRANAKKQNMPLGNTEQYVCEADIVKPTDTSIEIGGWVRWALDDDAFIDFVREVVQAYKVKELRCDYEEIGCGLYGHWLYEDDTGLLVARSVPEDYAEAQYQRFDPDNTGDEDAFEQIMDAIRNCPEADMCTDEAIDLNGDKHD